MKQKENEKLNETELVYLTALITEKMSFKMLRMADTAITKEFASDNYEKNERIKMDFLRELLAKLYKQMSKEVK